MPRLPDGYDRNVFINCPFDDQYRPIFKALVFATFECGLTPRCALEVADGAEVRIDKIMRIIAECCWGIHDISRTDMNSGGLPRFNMPLELGIFLGARRFGDRAQKRKSCLILDTERYRFQRFISDIAGQDPEAHGNNEMQAIKAVRRWLASSIDSIHRLPSAATISRRFEKFTDDLPTVFGEAEADVEDRTFAEYADAASTWLKAELVRIGAP